MSFSELLINTATIQRFTAGTADGYGNPVKTWANHLVNQPCRKVAAGGREIKVGAEVVVAEDAVFFENIDITEQDQAIIDGVTYEVILVLFRQDATGYHHKHCFLRTVR